MRTVDPDPDTLSKLKCSWRPLGPHPRSKTNRRFPATRYLGGWHCHLPCHTVKTVVNDKHRAESAGKGVLQWTTADHLKNMVFFGAININGAEPRVLGRNGGELPGSEGLFSPFHDRKMCEGKVGLTAVVKHKLFQNSSNKRQAKTGTYSQHS